MNQLLNYLLLAMPVACVARTVTQEEVFKELRDHCVHHSKTRTRLLVRKFFYLFTCEYCFSHWVAAGLMLLVNWPVFDITDWLSVVWIANVLMAGFTWLRLKGRIARLEGDRLERQNKGEGWN